VTWKWFSSPVESGNLGMALLLRNKDRLHEMLEEVCEHVVHGAEILGEALHDTGRAEIHVRQLKEVEHHCDETVHDLVRALNRSYFSPLSREHWHALASSLDDVLDFTYTSLDRLLMYRITEVPSSVHLLAEIILRQGKGLAAAVGDLHGGADSLGPCAEVKRLATEADHITAGALGELFAAEKNAFTVIKLKDLYRGLENATSSAKRAADLIEGVALKRGAA
jgi:uncharacterized protein Yka (UPF0111/DUF47 family)